MASRGKGRRRREAMELRASKGLLKRGKAGVASKLPPPPNKSDGEQLVPSSLRALMALRAGAPAPGKGRRYPANVEDKPRAGSTLKAKGGMSGASPAVHYVKPDTIVLPKSRNKFSTLEGHVREQQHDDKPSTTSDASSKPEAPMVRAGVQEAVIPPASPTARQLARRERVKAKRRKQKGRGKAATTAADPDNTTEPRDTSEVSSSDEDAVARRVMVDRHKPAFGEQAAAPLQAVLKRKHWDEGANSRHQALFAQQMQQASMRLTHSQVATHEALRSDVIEAYRKAKRQGLDGRSRTGRPGKEMPATRASLKALVAETARIKPLPL